MKKQVIFALLFLAGGFALPASAQGRGHYRGHHEYAEVFISGYRSCGTPIYAKRVHCGGHVRVMPLVGHELRSYLDRHHRRSAYQEALQRRLARERYLRARARARCSDGDRYGYRDHYRPAPRCR